MRSDMTPEIHFENTLTRKKELFTPLEEGVVRLYSCGPTVYHYAHLGNLRAYVTTDTVRRILVSAGYNVHAVINITDVGHLVGDGDEGEDKLEKGSRRDGVSAWDIAKKYTEAYMNDLVSLNIPLSAYSFPRATETIQEQIDIVRALEEKGFTYKTSDGIYFDTSLFPAYKDLAKLDLEGLKSGARVEDTGEKKNISDFVLWKFSPKDEKRQMEWESPWGRGFPGWHIECSAMSKKLLGPHFDIHMGGIDHIPVHHTNEIAQSECANGEKYVNYWLHYNFLNDATGKMSKSNGEFLRLQTIKDEGIAPLAYRYYLLLTHYRKEIQFSFDALRSAETAYKKLYTIMSEWNTLYSTSDETPHRETLESFYGAVYDDLGTPKGVATLWNMLGDSTISDEQKYVTVLAMDAVLGLDLTHATKVTVVATKEVAELLEKRETARREKNYSLSDSLRDEIRTHGFDVKDSKDGQELTHL